MAQMNNRGVEDLKRRFIYATQYYRPPTPPQNEWEEDMLRIKNMGLQAIKIWAMWTYIERKPREFEWGYLDGLLATAHTAGLEVIINIILDHIPLWAERKHESRIVQMDGNRMRPNRIYGGSFGCWDNLGLREEVTPFLTELVSRYSNRPALLGWDVWNEPDNFECYCRHTVAKYRRWLRSIFGSIEELNRFSGEAYGEWDDVEPPTHPEMISTYLLYTRFRMESLAEQIRWIYGIVKGLDPNHVVMTHSHSWATTNSTLGVASGGAGWDDWLLSKEVDLYGTSLHAMYYESQHNCPRDYARTILNLETKRSIGHYWVSEMTSGITRHRNMNVDIKSGELLFNLWTCIAHDAKGIWFWQFKPERYTVEAGGCGLIHMDGSTTFRSEEAKAFHEVIQQNMDLFVKSKMERVTTAILYSQASSVISSVNKMTSYQDAIHGAAYSLWMNNIPFDVIREDTDLGAYSHIFISMGLCIEPGLASKLIQWVKDGGTLVIENGFASYAENGWYQVTVPGYGMAEEFGIKERDILPSGPVMVDTDFGPIGMSGELRSVEFNDNVKVRGRFPDGMPAILVADYGGGRVIYYAGYVSVYAYHESDPWSLGQMLKGFGFKSQASVEPRVPITVRITRNHDSGIAFVFNPTRQPQIGHVKLDSSWNIREKLYATDGTDVRAEGKSLHVNMAPKGVAIILVDKRR